MVAPSSGTSAVTAATESLSSVSQLAATSSDQRVLLNGLKKPKSTRREGQNGNSAFDCLHCMDAF